MADTSDFDAPAVLGQRVEGMPWAPAPTPMLRVSLAPWGRMGRVAFEVVEGRECVIYRDRDVTDFEKPPDLGRMLQDFVQIAQDAGRVERFVMRYGPLGRFPRQIRRSVWAEPLEAFTACSAFVRALLSVIADLRGADQTRREDWAELDARREWVYREEVYTSVRREEGLYRSLPHRPECMPREDQAAQVATELSLLLRTVSSPGLVVMARPRFRFSLGLGEPLAGQHVWYGIVRRVVEMATAPDCSMHRCSLCGGLHQRQRARRVNAEALCPDCRRRYNTEYRRSRRATLKAHAEPSPAIT